MKIFIIDDHVLFRDGLVSLLESQPGFSVVGQTGTLTQAFTLLPLLNPDLILMDHHLPDGNGLEATQHILATWPFTSVVILSIDDHPKLILDAVQSGAVGFIPKNMSKDHFLASLRAVEKGEAAFSRKMTRFIVEELNRLSRVQYVEDDSLSELSFRELEVLRQLGMGASNREISKRLCIAENTVKSHVHNILDKLNLRNRSAARGFAHRVGLKSSSIREQEQVFPI